MTGIHIAFFFCINFCAPIINNIRTLYREHWKFLKTVVNKLFEFMHGICIFHCLLCRHLLLAFSSFIACCFLISLASACRAP